jgi:hypothetical protein
LAAAYARPAPAGRFEPGWVAPSEVQTIFEVAVATTPKASDCSYLLTVHQQLFGPDGARYLPV